MQTKLKQQQASLLIAIHAELSLISSVMKIKVTETFLKKV